MYVKSKKTKIRVSLNPNNSCGREKILKIYIYTTINSVRKKADLAKEKLSFFASGYPSSRPICYKALCTAVHAS